MMQFVAAAAVVIAFLSFGARAEEPGAERGAGGEQHESAARGDIESPEQRNASSRLRVEAELKYLTEYYFRGWFQEDEGLIVQPTVQAFLDLHRGDGWLRRVSLMTGIRNSVHEAQTGSDGSGPDVWYEADIVGGVNVGLFDRWEAEAAYVAITSPNGAWDTIQEVDLTLSYDDDGLWGDSGFSVRPFTKAAIEFEGSAAGGEESVLVQFGADPGFELLIGGKLPVRISAPAEIGLSPDRYYALPMPLGGDDHETFGYLRAGGSVSLPLWFISPEHGRWGVTGGADVLHLGDNLERFNGGDETEVIGRVSLGVRF